MADRNGFECPVLVTGDWKSLSENELDIVKRLVEANRADDWNPAFLDFSLRARFMPLAFYGDGWFLVDVEGRTVDGYGAFAFILGEDDAIAVTGNSSPIHELNARLSLRLNTADRHLPAYLKFFAGVIWGEKGPFRVVETLDEAAEWLEIDEGIDIPPMSVETVDKKAKWSAGLVHGGDLFRGTFQIHPGGQVEMLEDEKQYSCRQRVIVRPPLRVVPFLLPEELSE